MNDDDNDSNNSNNNDNNNNNNEIIWTRTTIIGKKGTTQLAHKDKNHDIDNNHYF